MKKQNIKTPTIGFICTFKVKSKNENNSINIYFHTVISENKKDCIKFKNKKDFSIMEIKQGDSSNISTSIETIDISNEEVLDVWEHRFKTLHDNSISEDFYLTYHKLGMWSFDNSQKINMEEVRVEFFQTKFPTMDKNTIISQIDTIEDFEIAIYENEIRKFCA